MRSKSQLDFQYAHRFLGYEGEAQYLHGHTGTLLIEVEGEVDPRTGFAFPCNKIKNIAWEYLKNFDHALILQEEDALLPHILDVYKEQGIHDGDKDNTTLGLPIDNELAKAYPEKRLVVVKKVATCENLLEIFYSLLKDHYNVKRLEVTSGDNAACREF